jgi:hypothetical protein
MEGESGQDKFWGSCAGIKDIEMIEGYAISDTQN